MFANEVIIPVKDITKIKHFDNAVVFYTEKKCWVCDKDNNCQKQMIFLLNLL